MISSHLTTSLVGVIGGLAAFAIAIALFAVLYRRLRHGGTKRPNSIPYKSEGASLDRPRDTITQPTVLPSLAPGHSMHPKLYVSLWRAVYFYFIENPIVPCRLGPIRSIYVPSPAELRPHERSLHQLVRDP